MGPIESTRTRVSECMARLSATEVAYLAGLYEGEGTFTLVKIQGRVTPRVGLKMTDFDIIRRVSSMIGTKVYGPYSHRDAAEHPEWKDWWETHLNSGNAIVFLRLILPLMGERRAARIREVLTELGSTGDADARFSWEGCRVVEYGPQPKCQLALFDADPA